MSPAALVHNRLHLVHSHLHLVHNRLHFGRARCTTVYIPVRESSLEGTEPTLSAPPQCARAHPKPKPKGVGGRRLRSPPLAGGLAAPPFGDEYS